MAAGIVTDENRVVARQKLARFVALLVSAGGSMMRGMGPSFPDMIFLFLLALVVFGPKKLPEIGRQVGKLLNELKRASNEFKAQIQTEMDNMEQQESAKKMLAPAEPPVGSVATLSLKPMPVADAESGDPGEVIDLKPVGSNALITEPFQPEAPEAGAAHPEPIVVHPLGYENSNGAESTGSGSREFDLSDEAGDDHHTDSAIKATNA